RLRFIGPTPRRAPAPASRFPYTTLFRSTGLAHAVVGDRSASRIRRRRLRDEGRIAGVPRVGHGERDDDDVIRSRRVGDERLLGRDRKSTRLNFSHQIISYAVFCFEKEN